MASKGVKITQAAVILTMPKYNHKDIFYVRVDTKTTAKAVIRQTVTYLLFKIKCLRRQIIYQQDPLIRC